MLLKWFPVACLMLAASSAWSAEVGGVSFAETQDVAGRHLVLNGTALRTYSVLGVRIYAAGLYLERPNASAEGILRSDEVKLVRFAFLRDIDAKDARKSWQEGLERECPVPCRIPPEEMERFLATVPSVARGDVGTLLFTRDGLELSSGGRLVGRIRDPLFMRTILATFIGPRTLLPEVRAGLLGGGR